MLYSIAYMFEPSWAIGPMVLFTLTFIIVTFYIARYRHARASIGYTAWIGVVAGFIYNTIFMALSISSPSINLPAAVIIFYTIYTAFAFVPGLVVFGKISRHQNNKIGKYTVYFGYLWAVMVFTIGLALTILRGKLFGENVGDETVTHYLNLFYFMYFSNWGFVAVFLVLFGMYLNVITGKARSTFIAYAALNLLSVIVFAIASHINNNYYDSLYTLATIVYGVLFALSDIPTALSFIIAIHYGHLWNLGSLNDNKVEVTDDDENKIGSDEPTRALDS